MKYLVAVSGGVDSVVLLDMLAGNEHELTVAHFDHGIRDDSADDARFVEGLAKKYGLPFVGKREELGKQASEELARTRRYAFLKSEAKKRNATIATAHHANDVIETIAINLVRGTGWRGLAVLDSPGIERPLLHMNKEAIYDYALTHQLEWVEDSTNSEDTYLRNRLRRKINRVLPETAKQTLGKLHQQQIGLKQEIDEELMSYMNEANEYHRYFFIHVDLAAAREVLRRVVMARTGLSPTRPQLDRGLLAIKTARTGTAFELGQDVSLQFTTRTFVVKTP